MIDLLSLLVALFLVNATLVIVVWNIYGSRIQTLIAKKGEKDQILGKIINFLILLQIVNYHMLTGFSWTQSN